jgi:peptidoglycan/LPS O-acetylase OafA/YrhL
MPRQPDRRRSADAPGRIDEIDSLRALAMTAVIAQHCRLLPFGWMGVWLFYVISGFVVTNSLMSRPPAGRGVLLKEFYVRRAARILPIYLGYVVLGFVVSGLTEGRLEWAPFASLALFYNNFQVAFADGTFRDFPVAHLWTISVEMQFYLFYGVAFALLPRRALQAVLVGFLVLAPVVRYLAGEWLTSAGFSPLRAAFAVYSFSVMHFDSFAVGALLALGAARWRQPPGSTLLFVAGCVLTGIYVLAYVLVNRAHGAGGIGVLKGVVSGILFGDGRQIWLYSAVAALSAGLLSATLAGGYPWAPFASNRYLQAVGRASYGGYIYHVICLGWARGLLRPWFADDLGLLAKIEFGAATFAITLPLTIALASASYHYLELPIIGAVGRRLKARRMLVATSSADSGIPFTSP